MPMPMPPNRRHYSGGFARAAASGVPMSPMSPPARPRFVERASTLSSDTLMSDELWAEDDEPVQKRRDDQPMSPLVVILYVVFFYVVWQILTRSDENEILSHLPATSPLRGHHQVEQPQQQPYQFPYPLPHIPSSIRNIEVAAAGSSSTWRTVIQSVLYPFYLLLTLAVIPLPFLSQALSLIMSVIGTILYPITSTTRLLSRTFIVGPLTIVNGIFQAMYPVYVFVGGVLGLGCFLGMTAGWLGQFSLDLLLSRKGAAKRNKQRRKSKKHSSQSAHSAPRSVPSSPEAVELDAGIALERSLAAGGRSPRQSRSPELRAFHGLYVPVVDIFDDRGLGLTGVNGRSAGRGSAREPVVVGIRRRGMRGDA